VGGQAPAAQDVAMHVLAPTPPVPSMTTMRCECGSCGVHVVLRYSWQISGQCRNCRSYDLRPLAPATTAEWQNFAPRRRITADRRTRT
jgi:hypothetical protein